MSTTNIQPQWSGPVTSLAGLAERVITDTLNARELSALLAEHGASTVSDEAEAQAASRVAPNEFSRPLVMQWLSDSGLA